MSGTVSSPQAPEGICAGSAQFEIVESSSEALGRGAAAAQGVFGVDGIGDGVGIAAAAVHSVA